MNWLPLTTDDEIQAFLSDVCDFHDAYLRAVHVVYGTGDGTTSPYQDNLQTAVCTLSIDTPSGPHGRMRRVEVRFGDLVDCHVRPVGPNFDPTILGVEIVRRGDVHYWCLDESLIGGTDSTWVGGRQLAWRVSGS